MKHLTFDEIYDILIIEKEDKMEKLTFRCLECGKSKEILGNIDDLDREDGFCPFCGADMELQDTDGLIDIAHIVNLDNLNQMKNHITELGSGRVWTIIEEFQNAKTRLAYRKLFFEAGGIMPEKRKLQ